MPMYFNKKAISDNEIRERIRILRNKKVILNTDLAIFFQMDKLEMRALVRKNMHCFSGIKMFQLSQKERHLIKYEIRRSDQNYPFNTGAYEKRPTHAFTISGINGFLPLVNTENTFIVCRLLKLMEEIPESEQTLASQLESMRKKLNHLQKIWEEIQWKMEELNPP